MFGTKKLCKNCKHFKKNSEMFGIEIGFCSTVNSTSTPLAGDFVFTNHSSGSMYNPDPLKVTGNFGCIRFKKR